MTRQENFMTKQENQENVAERYVLSIAKQYENRSVFLGVPFSDLIDAGRSGFMEAKKHYNPSKGFNFISYAVWWIRSYIINLLSDNEKNDMSKNFKIMSKCKDKQKTNSRDLILVRWENNFYKSEPGEMLDYFEKNNIAWWGGKEPTGNIFSSQIACLNHLFPIRNNKEEVLKIAQVICKDFVDVMKIETDKFSPAYIAFEAVSDNDNLNECYNGQKPSRGEFCTSIDALIYAKHKNGDKYIIPIEWKYKESYKNEDKSIENRKGEVEGERKGKNRLNSYSDLIKKSTQLKLKYDDYKNKIYFFEPFYQLMRQTLWSEQMCVNKERETIKADNFIHVNVVPQENTDLLETGFDLIERKLTKTGKSMKDTWMECLYDQDKYRIISPKELLANLGDKELLNYLNGRYWQWE
jgi:RNA polymerase sigma factor (sigma-70 family)